MTDAPIQKRGDSFEQDQFLTILSREDALARFEAALFPRSQSAAADAHEILELLVGDRAPLGLVDFLTQASASQTIS